MSKGRIPIGAGGATVERPYPACVDGGYPLIYVREDGGTLCADCANRKNGSIATASPREHDRAWRLVAAQIFYEGSAEYCDHCGAVIESAYGDPDAEKESQRKRRRLETALEDLLDEFEDEDAVIETLSRLTGR